MTTSLKAASVAVTAACAAAALALPSAASAAPKRCHMTPHATAHGRSVNSPVTPFKVRIYTFVTCRHETRSTATVQLRSLSIGGYYRGPSTASTTACSHTHDCEVERTFHGEAPNPPCGDPLYGQVKWQSRMKYVRSDGHVVTMTRNRSRNIELTVICD